MNKKTISDEKYLEHIEDIKNYILNRLMNAEYEIISADEFSVTIQIQDNEIKLWVANNPKEDLHFCDCGFFCKIDIPFKLRGVIWEKMRDPLIEFDRNCAFLIFRNIERDDLKDKINKLEVELKLANDRIQCLKNTTDKTVSEKLPF